MARPTAPAHSHSQTPAGAADWRCTSHTSTLGMDFRSVLGKRLKHPPGSRWLLCLSAGRLWKLGRCLSTLPGGWSKGAAPECPGGLWPVPLLLLLCCPRSWRPWPCALCFFCQVLLPGSACRYQPASPQCPRCLLCPVLWPCNAHGPSKRRLSLAAGCRRRDFTSSGRRSLYSLMHMHPVCLLENGFTLSKQRSLYLHWSRSWRPEGVTKMQHIMTLQQIMSQVANVNWERIVW